MSSARPSTSTGSAGFGRGGGSSAAVGSRCSRRRPRRARRKTAVRAAPTQGPRRRGTRGAAGLRGASQNALVSFPRGWGADATARIHRVFQRVNRPGAAEGVLHLAVINVHGAVNERDRVDVQERHTRHDRVGSCAGFSLEPASCVAAQNGARRLHEYSVVRVRATQCLLHGCTAIRGRGGGAVTVVKVAIRGGSDDGCTLDLASV